MVILGNDVLYEYIAAEMSDRDNSDDFYKWFASIVEINEVKCYIFTNKYSGLTSFFYDVHEADDFGQDFINSLATLLEANSINVDVFLNYFKDAGDVYFDIAHAEELKGFENIVNFIVENDFLIDKSENIQHALNNKINRMDMKFGEKSHQPIELFNQRLRKDYGNEIFNTTGVVLEVKRDDNKRFKRKMIVPIDFYFDYVHHAIELSVNADKSWHHEFLITMNDGTTINVIGENETIQYKDDSNGLYESSVCLRDVVYKTDNILYVSDSKPDNTYRIKIVGESNEYKFNHPFIVEQRGNVEDSRETLDDDELNQVYSLVFNAWWRVFMKILHTSDLHLGKKINGFELHDSQCEMLSQIANILDTDNVDILVIAGDIYDSKVPSIKAIELFDAFLNTVISELDKQVIIITGNHDSYERLSFGKSLFDNKLYIARIFENTIDTLDINNVSFHMIPYEDYHSVRVRANDDSITNFDSMYNKLLSNYTVNQNNINICVAHGYFSYAKENIEIDDSVRRIAIGGSEIVDTRYFKKFDICMFGHLHRPQKVINDLHRYSGTPIKYSFSEVNHQKSVCLYIINDDHITYELKPINIKNDLYLLNESINTLLDENFYSRLNLEGYFKLDIVGGVPSFELNKLKNIYKNIVEITYQTDTNKMSNKTSKDLKSKTVLDLFIDFYEESLGEEIDDETRNILDEVINHENK